MLLGLREWRTYLDEKEKKRKRKWVGEGRRKKEERTEWV